MKDFATYILKEEDYIQKVIIAYYFSKRTGIFFDKSIVLRAEIARIFMDYSMLDVDKNLILTAILLCNCKKVDDPQKIGKLETYAKEGAEYLATFGFNNKFCKICEELNRYSKSEPREKEGDVLELVDQFTGLILTRPERPAFTPNEALIILKDRNLKNFNNRYLNDFITFVEEMENVCIRENVDVPIIRKLVSIHNKEENVKSFIATLGNHYVDMIDELISQHVKKESKELLKVGAENNDIQNNTKQKNIVQRNVHRYVRVYENVNRALFTKESADRIMRHEPNFIIEEEE